MAAQLQNNIICLAVDRLHAGYLGAYGNTWINTPALDRLAAESFLLDRAIIDSPRLELLYRSLWQGLHAMVPAAIARQHQSLPEQFAQAGWQTVLLADDAAVAEHALATPFSERVLLKPAAHHHAVAETAEATQTAEFFAAAVGQLQQLKPPFFWWLHTAALGSIWDAPLGFREQYRDEDDPPAATSFAVPNKLLPEQFDPDQLLGISHAYAGQVTLLDQWVGSLLASIDELGHAQHAFSTALAARFSTGRTSPHRPLRRRVVFRTDTCARNVAFPRWAGRRRSLRSTGANCRLFSHNSQLVQPKSIRRPTPDRRPRPIACFRSSTAIDLPNSIGPASPRRRTKRPSSRPPGLWAPRENTTPNFSPSRTTGLK